MEQISPVALVALLLLAVSAVANAAFLRFVFRRNKSKAPQPTLTAEQLLHDLLAGGQAILRVEVIDPTNLLLRSPRR